MGRAATGALLLALAMGLLALHLSRPRSATARGSQVAALHSPASGEIPEVRVLLGAAPRGQWTIRVEGPYRVVAPGDWRVLAQGEELPATEVAALDAGLRIGEREFALHELIVEPIEPETLWVDRTRYAGRLQLVREDRQVAAINRVGLEDYLASVTTGEMPPDFPVAARRAQIVAARTYVLFHMRTFGAGHDYDVVDSPQSQNYLGLEYVDDAGQHRAATTAESRALAAETRGIVLLYQGRLFCAYYGAACGGHTGSAASVFRSSVPPLVGVPCEYCAGAPNHRWQRRVDMAAVNTVLRPYCLNRGLDAIDCAQLTVADAGRGRLPLVTLGEGDTSIEMSTPQFRTLIAEHCSLPSAFFSAEIDGDSLVIEGRGWGHTVGMCQCGAKAQAEGGRDWREILDYYYPTTTLGWVQ